MQLLPGVVIKVLLQAAAVVDVLLWEIKQMWQVVDQIRETPTWGSQEDIPAVMPITMLQEVAEGLGVQVVTGMVALASPSP